MYKALSFPSSIWIVFFLLNYFEVICHLGNWLFILNIIGFSKWYISKKTPLWAKKTLKQPGHSTKIILQNHACTQNRDREEGREMMTGCNEKTRERESETMMNQTADNLFILLNIFKWMIIKNNGCLKISLIIHK